jgi:hypothetical protein
MLPDINYLIGITCPLSGGNMLGHRRSEFAEIADLIRINEKRADELHELGRQMNALVDAIKGRITHEAAKSSEG